MKTQTDFPKRYYGLHFSSGVVEYPSLEKRVFVSPEVAKEMDVTYEGKPLFVQHVDEYDISKLPEQADGYVVRSFYNTLDGNHWVEFLANSDQAKQKIAEGWKLSNSYKAQVDNISGESKNVSYDASVTGAEYDHLALVSKPRYENSIILTPEEFKAYNDDLKAQLERLQNSKEEDEVMFFKKEKAKDADALKGLSVSLPKSKVEKTVMQLINEADEAELKKDEKKYANETDLVKIGDEEVTVGELVEKVEELIKEAAEEIAEEVAEELVDGVEADLENKEEDKKDEEKKLDNAKSSKLSALSLKNQSESGLATKAPKAPKYMTMHDQIELGRSKY